MVVPGIARAWSLRGLSAGSLVIVALLGVLAEPLVLTPDEAVSRALLAHPELRAAAHRQLATAQDALAAATQQFPTVSATGNYTHTGKLQTTYFGGRALTLGAEDAVSLTGRVDQPLFTGGRLAAQIAQAREVNAAELSRLEAMRQSVVLRTREACYEVIRSGALLDAAAEASASAEAHRRDAEARVRSGIAAGVEVTRADVRVAEAKLNEVSLRNRRDLATSRLALLMSLVVTTEISLTGDLSALLPGDDGLADEERALATRPDLQAVRLGMRVAELGVNVARAGYWPAISAFGTWNWQDDETRTNGDESWNVGLSGTWTIFDWGRTTRTAKAAEERSLAAGADVDAYQDRVRLEVQEARLASATARESIRLAEARVAAATEDRRISLLRFREGVGTGTEVIDAERDLAAARAALINAQADLAVAGVRHWYATGGTSPR